MLRQAYNDDDIEMSEQQNNGTLLHCQLSRAALLPERLKRKQNVRKREQNENVPALPRAAQPWRPGGSKQAGSTGVVGVQPQHRVSLSVDDPPAIGPLTSTFSIRDSLQSLRSSRVFKQKQTTVQKPDQPKHEHVRPPAQPNSASLGPRPRERPALQPISTRLSTSSRASSCGSNSGLQVPPSQRCSLSSLDSAVNQCISPTDDGQHCIVGAASTAHSAESRQQQQAMLPEPMQVQQEQPCRGVSTSLHIPQVAGSCCELLQLLQMDHSPTSNLAGLDGCSSALPGCTSQVAAPTSPRQAAAAPAVPQPPPQAQRAAHGLRPQGRPAAKAGAVSSSRPAVRLFAPKAPPAAVAAKPRSRVGSGAPALQHTAPKAARVTAAKARLRVGSAAALQAAAVATAVANRRLAAGAANQPQQAAAQQQELARAQPAAVSELLPSHAQQQLHCHTVPPIAHSGAAVQTTVVLRSQLPQQPPEDAVRPAQSQGPQQLEPAAAPRAQHQSKPPQHEAPVGALRLQQQQQDQDRSQQQQQLLPEGPEIVGMRKKLLAMEQQLLALQKAKQCPKVGSFSSLGPRVQVLTDAQQQAQLQEQLASGSTQGPLPSQHSGYQQQQQPCPSSAGASSAGAVVQEPEILQLVQPQQLQQVGPEKQAAVADIKVKTRYGAKQAVYDAQHCTEAVPPQQVSQQQQQGTASRQNGPPPPQQQQPPARQFDAPLNSVWPGLQQHNSTYHQLLEGTKALVANSHWQTTSLQQLYRGTSPLKPGCSPGRVGGQAKAPSGRLGGSPAFKQLSRLSVSQSWAGASPGPTPRPDFAAAAAIQQVCAGTAAAGVGEAVRARLFGPALGAASAALQPAVPSGAQLAGSGPTARDVGSLGARSFLMSSVSYSGQAVPQPVLTACSSPCQNGVFSLGFGTMQSSAHPQQRQQQSFGPPEVPGGGSSRPLLCTSRVAQVLFGTPSKLPAGLLVTHSQHSVPAAHDSAKQGPLAGQQPASAACGSKTAVAQGCTLQEGDTPGAGSCRYAEVSDSGGSGGAFQLGSDPDSSVESGYGAQGLVHCSRASVPQQQIVLLSGGAVQQQLGAGAQHLEALTESYEQQEEEQECWTVHTNWAAELDAETAAVAAAAAAAAGLSAQLGRGHAVKLQEHSPFPVGMGPFSEGLVQYASSIADGTQAAPQPLLGVDLAACSPMWVSIGQQHLPAAGAQGSLVKQDEEEEEQQCPPVCSPMCLMVPRKLWNSPEAEGR